jgi:hypothetical protein
MAITKVAPRRLHKENQRKEREIKRKNDERLIAELNRLKLEKLVNQYGVDIGLKLANQQYWVGMGVDLLLASKGKPTKIEKEVLKTKVKETYIYGNKSSGDYFVVENGLVTKFVDR